MTAHETTNKNHPDSPRSRFRFSLAVVLLVTTVVALAVALILANRQWQAEVEELETLRDISGRLSITDRKKIHAIGAPTVGLLKWQWHIYLPEDREYQLHLVTGKVPAKGIPANKGTPQVRSGLPRSGEFLLTAAVQKDRRGNWVLAASVPNRDFAHPIKNATWVNSGGHSIVAIEPGKTISIEAASPLVLTRVRVDGTANSDGKSEGLMIFIDEFK